MQTSNLPWDATLCSQTMQLIEPNKKPWTLKADYF